MGYVEQEVAEFDYTIKKPSETGDYRDTLIGKTGLKVEFTMAEVEADRALIAKQLKENKGQLVLEAAKIQNITTNHPFVLDLTQEQLFTCALLHQCMQTKAQAEKNIKILEDQDARYAQEVSAIMSKLGFVETSVPTTENVATEPVITAEPEGIIVADTPADAAPEPEAPKAE